MLHPVYRGEFFDILLIHQDGASSASSSLVVDKFAPGVENIPSVRGSNLLWNRNLRPRRRYAGEENNDAGPDVEHDPGGNSQERSAGTRCKAGRKRVSICIPSLNSITQCIDLFAPRSLILHKTTTSSFGGRALKPMCFR